MAHSAEPKPSFPKFEDLKVSTQTFIVMTNINILNFDIVGKSLPIYPYVIVPKRRGRKKKESFANPNANIPPYSIITVDLGKEVLGANFKEKEDEKGAKKGVRRQVFRNSFSVYMTTGDFDHSQEPKCVNMKICQNGNIQMTGCKTEFQAESCIKRLWEYMSSVENAIGTLYTIKDGNHFNATFIPAMRNIDFSFGINVNRERLNTFFNEINIHSLLETQIGYTGVNIKFPVTKPLTDLRLKKLTISDEMTKLYLLTYNGRVIISTSDRIEAEQVKQSVNELKLDETVKELIFENTKPKKIDMSKYTILNVPATTTVTREKITAIYKEIASKTTSVEASAALAQAYEGLMADIEEKNRCGFIDETKLRIQSINIKKWRNDIEYVDYQTYLDTKTKKEQTKKLTKKKWITFLIFHSGNTIMSSMCAEFSRDTYNEFVEIIGENYKEFIEILDD